MVGSWTKLIILVLLLPLSALAVSPRGDSIRVAAWGATNIPSGGTAKVTEQWTLNWTNDGIQLISSNLPAYEKLDTIEVLRGVDGYALNSDFDSLSWVLRFMGDSSYIPSEKSSPEEAYTKRQGVQGSVDDPVSTEDPRYFWVHAHRLFFYPAYAQTFGGVDTLLVAYYAVAPPLANAADTTVIDKKYLSMLVDYVAGKIKEAQSDMAWANWYFSKVPFMTFKVSK